MKTEQFIELIQDGREKRNLEFKQSSPWGSREFKDKITKSVLGLSNIRDGGDIVIGMERSGDDTYEPMGSPQIIFRPIQRMKWRAT
jgi:hypothetical protein